MPLTLFDKIWNQHIVTEYGDGTCLLYIDRIFLHERTGGIALSSIHENGYRVARPEHVFATMDHIVDTQPGRGDNSSVPNGHMFIETTRKESKKSSITLFDIDDERQGISHVISPEQGIPQPGLTMVCPDSHTCTLGALGALAWGIGSSDCEHALVTETLRIRKPEQMRVRFEGNPGPAVSAKDMILYLISKYGAGGANGYMIEFSGSAVQDLSVEARMTLCNMAVEFSAFSGIIAPDEKSIAYLNDRPFSPRGKERDLALEFWQNLHTDKDAQFDKEIVVDCNEITATVTWGTSPQHAIGISERIPAPDSADDPETQRALQRALDYMGLKADSSIKGTPIDVAFIGSCTNSRLSDLRIAASVLKGCKIAKGVKAICVPGSSQVKKQAEAEGLDEIFRQAGFEWRESGCSMCFMPVANILAQDKELPPLPIVILKIARAREHAPIWPVPMLLLHQPSAGISAMK